MATPFREMSWPVQALAFLGLAVVLVLVGLYLPGSPVQSERVGVDNANAQLEPLQKEVQTLRVYEQRRVELQGQMEAQQKQLATLQAIVPENKEMDQFITMVQGAASGAGVSIRKIVAQPVVAKEYHYEMPITLTADGPYFSVMDFFARLARLSRIINVGDVKLAQINDKSGSSNSNFRLSPGTTVTGDFIITTYYSEPAEQAAAGAKPQAAGVAGTR